MAIAKLDILSISEYDLFMLICDWAVKEAERDQLDNSIRNQRFVLLNILPLIRFPTMDHEKLAIEVRQTGLLTTEELNELYSHVLSKGAVDTKYPTVPRQSPSIPCLSNSPLQLGQKPPSPHNSQHGSNGPNSGRRNSPPLTQEKPHSPVYALAQFSVFNHELPPPKNKSLTKAQSRTLSAEHQRKISDQPVEGLVQEVEGESLSPGSSLRHPIQPQPVVNIGNKPRARSD